MPCTCGRANFTVDTCPSCRFNAPRAQQRQQPPPPPQVARLLPGQLPVGAMLAISCARVGSFQFTQVASGTTIHVLQGTEIDFRAGATGLAPGVHVEFASALWGGTAGAAGNNGAQRIRFINTSVAPNAGVTVTLAFGGQQATLNVIVFSLTPRAVIADNFLNRSTTDLGVDERVSLDFVVNPAGITAQQAGGLRWECAGEAPNRDTVGLFIDPATNAAPTAPFTGTADYIAPCRTATQGAPVPSKNVTLQLTIVGGVCAGLHVDLHYTIWHPVAHMREVAGGARRHIQGQPSAGFLGEVFLTPRKVSFRTLRWREGTGDLVVSGSFPAGWAGMGHPVTVFANAAHGTIQGGHIVNGSVVNQQDNVFSGGFPYAVPPRASARNEAGSAVWPIKWEYEYPNLVGGGGAGVWIPMQVALHEARLYEDGSMTIFKGHRNCATNDCMPAPLRKDINDPTVP